MGRMRPAWYYQRQADQAEARANYFRNRQPPPEGQAVQSRGPAVTAYYRSLLVKDGTEHRVFSTSVYQDTITRLPLADAGLLTTLPAGTSARPLRKSGVRPTKIHWYSGNANATVVRTQWNSAWVRYYDATGRSHFSIPFSEATGAFGPEQLTDQFELLFGTGGSRRALIGAQNGRAYIEFERASISALS